MEKLKSSFRSFQEAISSIKPTHPICIHKSRTQTCRGDPYSSISYTNCDASTSSNSSSSCSFGLSQPNQSAYQQNHSEEDLINYNRITTLPSGPAVSYDRFFFSPCTTKDIMEEFKSEMGREKLPPLYKESMPMVMVSDDPYHDFQASMKEMVEAYKLKDWPQLQELLHSYLRLNETKTHKTIVLAFYDLIMLIKPRDNNGFSQSLPLTSYLDIDPYK